MTENTKNAEKPPLFSKGGRGGPGRPRRVQRPPVLGDSGYEVDLIRRAEGIIYEFEALFARYPDHYP